MSLSGKTGMNRDQPSIAKHFKMRYNLSYNLIKHLKKKYAMSLRKFALYLLILISINELVVTTVRPMALAVYEGAVILASAIESLGIAELVLGAVALAESACQINIHQAAVHVAHKHHLIEQGIIQKEGAAITQIAQEYSQHIDKNLVAQKDEQEIKTQTLVLERHFEKQISSRCIQKAHAAHVATHAITYPFLHTPVEFKFDNSYYEPGTTMIPNGFRTSCGDGYFQMQFKPIAVARPKSRFEKEQDFINRYWINDPYFQEDVQLALDHCLNVLIQTNSPHEHIRIEARLACIDLTLPGYYGAYLNNTVNQLLSYYFKKDGHLEPYHQNDDFEFIIYNYLICHIFDQKNAVRILKQKNLLKAAYHLEHPNYVSHATQAVVYFPYTLGYKVKECFYDKDPADWKSTIRQNTTNQHLRALIQACKRNDWQTAQHHLSYCNSYGNTIYQKYYDTYIDNTFDAYGLYRCTLHDPYRSKIDQTFLQELKTNTTKRNALNAELLMRLDWKKRIQDAWRISSDAHPAVHHALYQLVGISNTHTLIDTIFNIIASCDKNREVLVQAFFEPDGTLKDIANAQNYCVRPGSAILKPELHILCHQYNQILYSYNSEKDVARKTSIENALKLIQSTIQDTTCYTHQPAIQELYEGILNNHSWQTINQAIDRFYNQDLKCMVDTPHDEDQPEIKTCPHQPLPETIISCGTQSPEDAFDNRTCIQGIPEIENIVCGSIQGIDTEPIGSCKWGQEKPLVVGDESLIGAIECEIETIDIDIPTSDDQPITEEIEPTSEKKSSKKQSIPKKSWRPWDISDHDPAIDVEKIDFSILEYLNEQEIELIRLCIELFEHVEGFLANDGALWRILKFEDQKRGALFELECVVELHEQQNTIIKMGEEVNINGKLIEIDIETDTELMECKSGVWEIKDELKIKKLKSKFLSSNEYSSKIQKKFIIVSQGVIPLIWVNWLEQNNINYIEIKKNE